MAQRILASHTDIATTAEPWILLPYLYTLRERGIYAEYSHTFANEAIEDFCHKLPNGKYDYLEGIRELVIGLYGKAAKNNEKFFLDKSPRYDLVVKDIIQLFPDGKFIFLWRNPLSVVASCINWSKGKWNLDLFKIDLFEGLANLVEAYRENQDRVVSVRYEDLVINPHDEWKKIFTYLDLPFNDEILINFTELQFKGRMGDTANYQTLSREPLNKWKQVLRNPVRKAWCKRYLRWLGEERLKIMGYSMEELISELNDVESSPKNIGSDIMRISFGFIYFSLDFRILRHKLRAIPPWYRLHGHI
jgi:hypothetical protein